MRNPIRPRTYLYSTSWLRPSGHIKTGIKTKTGRSSQARPARCWIRLSTNTQLCPRQTHNNHPPPLPHHVTANMNYHRGPWHIHSNILKTQAGVSTCVPNRKAALNAARQLRVEEVPDSNLSSDTNFLLSSKEMLQDSSPTSNCVVTATSHISSIHCCHLNLPFDALNYDSAITDHKQTKHPI
jgi:hypothetical protein